MQNLTRLLFKIKSYKRQLRDLNTDIIIDIGEYYKITVNWLRLDKDSLTRIKNY